MFQIDYFIDSKWKEWERIFDALYDCRVQDTAEFSAINHITIQFLMGLLECFFISKAVSVTTGAKYGNWIHYPKMKWKAIRKKYQPSRADNLSVVAFALGKNWDNYSHVLPWDN